MAIATINPTTGQLIRTFPALESPEIHARIAFGYSVFHEALLRPDTVAARAKVLERAAQILEARKKEFARLITLEMGKALSASIAEVQKCAWACRYYAEEGPAFLAAETVFMEEKAGGLHVAGEIHHLPLGVVLAVMPWNFPFWQVFRCAAPILLSGNSMLLKHASNVPQCALAIEEVWSEAGLETGAFHTLLIDSAQVPQIIDDAQVLGVTLTGSEPAGASVAAQAGKRIKKTVLELGGSDPFIVLPSADLERAAATAITARIQSNGQSCIAAKRFIVHADVYDEFRRRLLAQVGDIRTSDPLDENCRLGPLATAKIRDDLHGLVSQAVSEGAKLLAGGELPGGEGFYYPATVLEDIPMSAHLYSDEAFGPVFALYRFEEERQAIDLANATRFGLGASVWTRDPGEEERFIREILSGCVFVNGMVASDPRVPFGGTKSSGYGRELGAIGAREFTNTKTVVRVSGDARS